MTIRTVDPTEVPGWDSGLLRTGRTGFFHSAAWARVLKESYGYRPRYLTASEDGRLILSVPLMEARSFWTGTRGVSLPFTDSCDPYFSDRQTLREALETCLELGKDANWRYLDLRSAEYHDEPPPAREVHYGHAIPLSKDKEGLFARLDPSNQRNIRKAIRSGLAVDIGTSWNDLASFCRLNGLTRKRHGLPPQPPVFFKKVFEHVLSKGSGFVLSARIRGRVIAASVYFHFGKQAVFKYGASEPGSLDFRPNNLIMWTAIEWFCEHDFGSLDLGRTELDNPGLLRYKRAWGASERLLRYYRFDFNKGLYIKNRSTPMAYKGLFSRMPLGLLRVIGRIAYRHMG